MMSPYWFSLCPSVFSLTIQRSCRGKSLFSYQPAQPSHMKEASCIQDIASIVQLEASNIPPKTALTDGSLYNPSLSLPSPRILMVDIEPRQRNNWSLCPSSWSRPIKGIPDWILMSIHCVRVIRFWLRCLQVSTFLILTVACVDPVDGVRARCQGSP